jgi:hypothetical protein
MGACIGNRITIKVKCKSKQHIFTGITDFTVLRMEIQEKLKIGSSFDCFVKKKIIGSSNDFKSLIQGKKKLKVIVKEKQVELIPPPIKPVAVAAKIEVRAHKKVAECLYTLVDKTETPMFTTMLLSKVYVVVHKRYVPKNPASLFFHTKKIAKEKMDPILEFSEFWLYKLTSTGHPSLPQSCCRRFERKGKILGDPSIELKQDFNIPNLFKAPEYLNSNYLGFPVFYRHNLLGFISKVQEDNITIESSYDIVHVVIPSTIRVRTNQDTRERHPPQLPEKPIKYHPEPPPPDEIDVEYERRLKQEKEIPYFIEEELEKLEISLNLDIGQSSPTIFSYAYMNGFLVIYSTRNLKPKVVRIDLNLTEEEATFTTTPEGLIVVHQKNAWIIGEDGKKEFASLAFSHVRHGAVWHKSKIFVVGGAECNKVEFFEFPLQEDPEENIWNKAPDLPVNRENFGICSYGEYVYVFGGKEGNSICDSGLRLFGKDWESLSWKLPQKLEGIAVICHNHSFVIFGGRAKVLLNKKFYVFEENGSEKAKGNIPIFGMFSTKSIGFADDVYSLIVTKNKILEYQGGVFKVVVTDY